MSNYDDILREKENDDLFNDSQMEKHWAALEKKMDNPEQTTKPKYRKLFRTALTAAAVLLIVFLSYIFLNEEKQQPRTIAVTAASGSAITPPLPGTNMPYESFSFNATTGDTLFTLNGSIIIFPANAVLNGRGETIEGNIEVRTREFNDPFDYCFAGIPMDYDSAGTNYKFISSAMIDISAFKNGEQLQVNPVAKPQLNLVSTNNERNSNLYKLDTVTGKWINKGKDEVNLVQLKIKNTDVKRGNFESLLPTMPAPPQKASALNPVINVIIDPASFKELLVYDGLKFEVTDANAGEVEVDSKTEWDNIELKRGQSDGSYKVIFSDRSRKVIYNVKPVLEGKDFEAAEKLYQQKLKEFARLRSERETSDTISENENKRIHEENRRIEELNKLIALRNRFIEARNKKIDELNNEYERRRDSAIKAKNEQKAKWENDNRIAALNQNLIRSFTIDSFGYWNCDLPTLPPTQPYICNFKTTKNEEVYYNTLCIAEAGINRIQNYYKSRNIGLVPNSNYFGWAFKANQVFYFTTENFKNALVTSKPDAISIVMTLYEGDVKNYKELKANIFNANRGTPLK